MLSAGTGAGGIGATESSEGEAGAAVPQPPQAASAQPVSQQDFLQQLKGLQNNRLIASQTGVHDEQQVFLAQPPQLVSQAAGAAQVAAGAAQAGSGAAHEGAAQDGAAPHLLFEQHELLQQNKLLSASRSGVQQRFLQQDFAAPPQLVSQATGAAQVAAGAAQAGSGAAQAGSGAQQLGFGAQQVAARGAQQLGLGRQQRGFGAQHLGVLQQDVAQPLLEPRIWSNSPAAKVWLLSNINAAKVPSTMFCLIRQRLLQVFVLLGLVHHLCLVGTHVNNHGVRLPRRECSLTFKTLKTGGADFKIK